MCGTVTFINETSETPDTITSVSHDTSSTYCPRPPELSPDCSPNEQSIFRLLPAVPSNHAVNKIQDLVLIGRAVFTGQCGDAEMNESCLSLAQIPLGTRVYIRCGIAYRVTTQETIHFCGKARLPARLGEREICESWG
jgi:hypothetical protein